MWDWNLVNIVEDMRVSSSAVKNSMGEGRVLNAACW